MRKLILAMAAMATFAGAASIATQAAADIPTNNPKLCTPTRPVC